MTPASGVSTYSGTSLTIAGTPGGRPAEMSRRRVVKFQPSRSTVAATPAVTAKGHVFRTTGPVDTCSRYTQVSPPAKRTSVDAGYACPIV